MMSLRTLNIFPQVTGHCAPKSLLLFLLQKHNLLSAAIKTGGCGYCPDRSVSKKKKKKIIGLQFYEGNKVRYWRRTRRAQVRSGWSRSQWRRVMEGGERLECSTGLTACESSLRLNAPGQGEELRQVRRVRV